MQRSRWHLKAHIHVRIYCHTYLSTPPSPRTLTKQTEIRINFGVLPFLLLLLLLFLDGCVSCFMQTKSNVVEYVYNYTVRISRVCVCYQISKN